MKYEIIVKAKAKPEDKKDQQRQPGGWDHRSGREDTFRPRERPRANSNQLRTDGWYNAMQTVYRAHRGATAVIHQSFEEVRKNAEVL